HSLCPRNQRGSELHPFINDLLAMLLNEVSEPHVRAPLPRVAHREGPRRPRRGPLHRPPTESGELESATSRHGRRFGSLRVDRQPPCAISPERIPPAKPRCPGTPLPLHQLP